MPPQPILPQSLDEWLDLLETRHPKEIELGLDRVGRVAEQLGLTLSNSSKLDSPASDKYSTNLPIAKQIITVAGTNGKGSCVAAIDSILRLAGYQVGTYTSPHFIDYNERICINGTNIDDESICAAFERIETARENISLSYFEFGTLAAFLIMADHELDVAVLEVGLGGRLDAVNILDADIAVVTSIALDHESWLGSDLNIIAAEKAAIGRRGKPLLYGDMEPVPGLLEKAASIGVELMINGDDFCLPDFYRDVEEDQNIRGFAGHLLPENSVACAVQAVNLLIPDLPQSVFKKGLESVHIKGRYQQLDIDGIHIVLDVAHNPQAAELLAERLSTLPTKKTAVFAVMNDKDIEGILGPLLPLIHSWYFCDIPGQARAAKARHLVTLMYNKTPSLVCDVEISPLVALQKAIAASVVGDTIVVFGSFFTVGPVLSWLESLD